MTEFVLNITGFADDILWHTNIYMLHVIQAQKKLPLGQIFKHIFMLTYLWPTSKILKNL